MQIEAAKLGEEAILRIAFSTNGASSSLIFSSSSSSRVESPQHTAGIPLVLAYPLEHETSSGFWHEIWGWWR